VTSTTPLDEVAAIIADAMALGLNAWMVIVVDAERLSPTVDSLHQELDFHARDMGTSVGILDAPRLLAADLSSPDDDAPRAFVIRGLESASVEQIAHLDLDRDRFVDAPTIVIVTTPEGASRLAVHAPNLWSWVGSQCFRAVEPEPMDAQSRIRSIRDELGISEEELVRRVEAGAVRLDPVLAEWLVLIGRGDLVDG
jgi:hypothetical protein